MTKTMLDYAPTGARPPAHARASVVLPPVVRKFVNQLAARRAEQFEIGEAARLKIAARRLLDSKMTPDEVAIRLASDE